MYFQACVMFGARRVWMPLHPPAFITARIASGEKPITMRKNCSTSL